MSVLVREGQQALLRAIGVLIEEETSHFCRVSKLVDEAPSGGIEDLHYLGVHIVHHHNCVGTQGKGVLVTYSWRSPWNFGLHMARPS